MTVRRFNVQVGNNLAICKTYFDTTERDILFIGLIDKLTWIKFIKTFQKNCSVLDRCPYKENIIDVSEPYFPENLS